MKIHVFVNSLGLGGTEKAACRWAWGLKERGHQITVLTLNDGPRKPELEAHGVPVEVLPPDPLFIAQLLERTKPDAIHTHSPGFPTEGDVLGQALAKIPKIPVVQTNVFGRLENPTDRAWTDFRLFISWTSCVQAAQRAFLKLDLEFFRKASVAVYPLDSDDGPSAQEIADFRSAHGIAPDDVVFGRISRPEPNKWTDLPLMAFRKALQKEPSLKLILREPPPLVAEQLRNAPDHDRFIILPATSNASELRLTLASLDVVLHTSSIGESFGYGIAEPMNYGKPVIANSVPWLDQAQIELVRHSECGYIASTADTICEAILKLATNKELRISLGANAQRHIRKLASPNSSLNRLEEALVATVEGKPNPHRESDLQQAQDTLAKLKARQFGETWREQLALRPFYYRVRFHQWRKVIKQRLHPQPSARF